MLRRFNRTVTRRIGVLQDRFLGRGRPVGESRFLFEVGPEGSNVRSLRKRLGLDSGYTSRLLRSLEEQGLVTTRPAPDDARIRLAELTEKGMAERQTLDQLSDQVATGILAGLDEQQREKLVAAMDTVERLLRTSEVVIDAQPAGSDDARWCLKQYFLLLNERFSNGYDPVSAEPADHSDFAPPHGIFLVARDNNGPVGCIGLRTALPDVGEIKRLWVAEAARGAGLGQKLLTRAEEYANRFRFKTLRLDTNAALTEAQALYLKNGYREVPPFNDDPYPDHWFEKQL